MQHGTVYPLMLPSTIPNQPIPVTSNSPNYPNSPNSPNSKQVFRPGEISQNRINANNPALKSKRRKAFKGKRAMVREAPVNQTRLNLTTDILQIHSVNRTISLSKDMICYLLDVPAIHVAKELGISVTLLKKVRTWAGIPFWPTRLVYSGMWSMSRDEIFIGRRRLVYELRQRYGDDDPMVSLLTNLEKISDRYGVIMSTQGFESKTDEVRFLPGDGVVLQPPPAPQTHVVEQAAEAQEESQDCDLPLLCSDLFPNLDALFEDPLFCLGN